MYTLYVTFMLVVKLLYLKKVKKRDEFTRGGNIVVLSVLSVPSVIILIMINQLQNKTLTTEIK